MIVHSESEEVKQFGVHNLNNDKALVNERRSHIITCSAKAFTKKGFHRTNMREISQACQMSAGSLYNYFSSKDEILYAIINRDTYEQAEYFETVGHQLDNLSPSDALTKLIRAFCQWHHENQDMTLFAYQETRNLPNKARQDIFNSEIRILAVFENSIKKGCRLAEFDTSDPKLIAHDIIIIGHAWAIRRWFLSRYCSLETYIQVQTESIFRAINFNKITSPVGSVEPKK
jgi:TetR/AcrR family transcriptional regulator, cholesterol catabolism regulator